MCVQKWNDDHAAASITFADDEADRVAYVFMRNPDELAYLDASPISLYNVANNHGAAIAKPCTVRVVGDVIGNGASARDG